MGLANINAEKTAKNRWGDGKKKVKEALKNSKVAEFGEFTELEQVIMCVAWQCLKDKISVDVSITTIASFYTTFPHSKPLTHMAVLVRQDCREGHHQDHQDGQEPMGRYQQKGQDCWWYFEWPC